MSGSRGVLERIAAALERLAPPVSASTDWRNRPAYIWDGSHARPISQLDALSLGQLRGIDEQKSAVAENVKRLATGAAAHDMLLWGARGMGKSALIRAVVRELQETGDKNLGLVQLTPGALPHFGDLLEELIPAQRPFLVFIDDLGFGKGETQDNLALRTLLDGGVFARPSNIRLAVTSNRRSIVAREPGEDTALHERDERDNALALADRFGLTLGFHPCDRATYLEILRTYTEPLGVKVDEEEALGWAIARGNRSGRTAYQFACELAGRAGLSL